MKNAVALSIILTVAVTSSVFAGDFDWRGGEFQVNLLVNLPITDHIGVNGTIIWWRSLSDDAENAYAYTGLNLTVYGNSDSGSVWVVTPKLGFVQLWFEEDGFITSAWNYIRIGDRYLINTQSDVYWHAGQKEYYGFYTFDREIPVKDNVAIVGLGAEQVEKQIWFGPHAGISRVPCQVSRH